MESTFVATLVPEEDAWQFQARETCTTEIQSRDREQELIAVVNYEDPSTSGTIETQDARTGERLDSEEVRYGRAKEVRELHELEVKMEVDESEMQVTPGEKFWSNWVETRKYPNSPAIRCRLCATEVNTGEPRCDTFAATPPLKFVRLIFELGSELQAQSSKCVALLCLTFRWRSSMGKCAK